MTEARETFISVDVETSGPSPSLHSLLSIGACVLEQPESGFYVELKPVGEASDPGAVAVSGLSLERLAAEGASPADAMAAFEDWLAREVPAGHTPVFVGFNAPFDWMFVCDYFERFLGRNPFGHAALDIKSYYLGMAGGSWAQTSMRELAPRYLDGRALSHNALSDARDQAELFLNIMTDAKERRRSA